MTASHNALKLESPEDLLTTTVAAIFLSVSAATLRRWRSLGFGPAFIYVGGKPGNAVRYRRSALIAWLNRNTVAFENGGDNVRR